MRLSRALCVSSFALVLLFAVVAEARTSRHHGRHHSRKQQEEEQTAQQVQQEEPSVVPAKEVEAEPEAEKADVESSGSAEKPRPVTRRKAVLCNANTAASNLGKADEKKTKPESFEVNEPDEPESLEIHSISSEEKKVQAPSKGMLIKPMKKPKARVFISSEESDSMSEEDKEDDETGKNLSAAIASIEEPAEPEPPKALDIDEIPEKTRQAEKEEDSARAVESEEEKPKVRRSKHHRKDVRKIERPHHRRRVVFRSSDEDDE